MTDETISYIIDLINKGESQELVFLRPLTSIVLFGMVWVNNSDGEVCKDSGYNMFFIKNEKQIIVAAVLDMGEQDLHVFVKPESRGNGYLVNALKENILPYLFSNGRQKQNITFKTEKARKHAEFVGFKLQSENSAVIYPNDIKNRSEISLNTTKPSTNQRDRIKQRIRIASDYLKMARDDLQTSFGENDQWESLDWLAHEVTNEVWNIHDLWQDYEEGIYKK